MTWRKSEVIIIFCFVIAALGMQKSYVNGIDDRPANLPKPIYTEESYQLKDGTPCTIVQGRRFTGISCNYSKNIK